MNRFVVEPGWKALLIEVDIAPSEILRLARLPEDLFSRIEASLSVPEYLRLWSALETMAQDPALPLRMLENLSAELFSPPLFAALCSPDLATAAERIRRFKPLIGPMRLSVHRSTSEMRLTIDLGIGDLPAPAALVAVELGFFVQLARLATRTRIVPLAVTAPVRLPDADAYTEFFGVAPRIDRALRLRFSAEDAERPFVTENAAMWRFFEPELCQRLSQLTTSASVTARTRAALLELIPVGFVGVDHVASKLALSRRTLQRRLADEGTSFKDILAGIRLELATHYIHHSGLPYTQISFLLGYDDPNSFFRAFNAWTGTTPERVRAMHVDTRG